MSTAAERYTPGASSSDADVEFCDYCGEIFCPCCRKPLVTKCCKKVVCLFCVLETRKSVGNSCPFCVPSECDSDSDCEK